MKQAPWMLRHHDAPSETALDAYAVGEASPEQIEAVEAWAARDPAHARALATRLEGFAGLPGAQPQAMLARIRLAAEAASGPDLASAPQPRRSLLQRLALPLGVIAAAAAAAILWVKAPGPPQDLRVETVTAKGGLTLRVLRRRGEQVDEMVSGDEAAAGDRLRFIAGTDLEPGHVLVVGAEVSGAIFPYLPADGDSLAVSALDADGALPGAVALDDSSGREYAFLVWCPHAFGLEDLGAAEADRLPLPVGCHAAAFAIHKP